MKSKLEEITDLTKKKLISLEFVPEVYLTEKIKSALLPIFKRTWNNGVCYFNDCTFVIETSKTHYSFMPNQYFFLAVELFDLANELKETFDIFDNYFRDEISKKVINALQAPIKKGQRLPKEDIKAVIVEKIPFAKKVFSEIGDIKTENFCFLIGNLSENKKFGSLDNNTFRATSDLYGSYLLNVAPLTTAESGTFGDLMYTLVSYPQIYSELKSNVKIIERKEKKITEDFIQLSTTAKECARQIIQKIYEYDKFENIKSILRINTNIKIDTDEICPEDVLYNVFYTAGSEQFNNEKRTFLDKEYEIRINDINITCRLTNQWCGFGEAGDERQNSRNYLWALRDIINIHYEGIFKIENDGANAKIICFNESQVNKYILKYKTAYESNKTRNRIIFGAPGTGKSYKLNQDSMELIGTEIQEDIAVPNSNYYERVTFHPNFSYAQFVGTYKPITKLVDGNETITYEYVPGPFIRILIKALRNARDESEIRPYLLIIEEINRANVAAVFGDIFQLLDRNSDGISEYEIETSEDLRKYLSRSSILGGKPEDYKKIRLPNNLFIWTTMNSADQGVFPMDTAFKRRWEFEYIGIDDNEKEVVNIFIPICKEGNILKKAKWNDIRKAINNKLISLGINEDKLLGPFFLSKSVLESAMDSGKDFVKLFESKVLMYLFEDAAKMKVKDLFNVDNNRFIYSEVCKKFEKNGIDVFKFNTEDKVSCEDIKSETPSNGELFTDET